eukprot:355400-Chlamydomonas_euryale.AAC.10
MALEDDTCVVYRTLNAGDLGPLKVSGDAHMYRSRVFVLLWSMVGCMHACTHGCTCIPAWLRA